MISVGTVLDEQMFVVILVRSCSSLLARLGAIAGAALNGQNGMGWDVTECAARFVSCLSNISDFD
jgi:hypothetical protein